MPSDAQKRATAKYRKDNCKQISLKFFPKDHDLYEYVKSRPRSYILDLIRKDMTRD